ncbi:MAG: 1-acyl-sn-glycerol-3-phosphate acyltransferase [Bacteroidales bacterium]|nr:1-acyl-sn-glycerol-3-phosphate acyltransferase [Bacteroidales bacterium]MBN2757917.1 1-acyl-sn-glycerol-3-phosphate acyltransferase [Bacteroidales bacterium]
MKYLYTAYVWIIGGLYFFLISSIAILLIYLISAKKTYPIYNFLLKGLFKIMFVSVKVEYAEEIEKNTNYLFMSNHVSLLDAPLMFVYIPQFVNALEAQEHFSWPIYGKLIKLWGNIPVNRKNAKSSYTSMLKAKDVLKDRNSVIIFPEGGRTVNGKMKRFKKLPFHLAKDAQVPIVPIGMSGVFSLNHKGSILVRPGKIKIKFGEIYSAEKVQNYSDDELMEKVKNEIDSLIEFL